MSKVKTFSIRFLLGLTGLVATCLGIDQRMSTWRIATYEILNDRPIEFLRGTDSNEASEYSTLAIHDLTTLTDRVCFQRRIHVDYVVTTPSDTSNDLVTFGRRLKVTAGTLGIGRADTQLDFSDWIQFATN